MNKRRIVVLVVVIALAAGLWLGGRALWDALVAMHQPHVHG